MNLANDVLDYDLNVCDYDWCDGMVDLNDCKL